MVGLDESPLEAPPQRNRHRLKTDHHHHRHRHHRRRGGHGHHLPRYHPPVVVLQRTATRQVQWYTMYILYIFIYIIGVIYMGKRPAQLGLRRH